MCWRPRHCLRPGGSFEIPQIPNSFSPIPSNSLDSSVLKSERPDRGVAEAWREEEVLPWTDPHPNTDSEAASTPAAWLTRLHLWPLSSGDSPVGLS